MIFREFSFSLCREKIEQRYIMKEWISRILFVFSFVFVVGETHAALAPLAIEENAIREFYDDELNEGGGMLFHAIHKGLERIRNLSCDLSHLALYSKGHTSRVRRCAIQGQNMHLRLLLHYRSLRDAGLLIGKSKLFPSTYFHCVIFPSEYYVFALRKIVI